MGFILKFFPHFGPKKSFFLFLSSAPACFFWPEKSFFSFFLNWSIFGLYYQFCSPTVCPSSAPACFFLARKVLFFFKLLNFWTLFSNFFPNFGPKKNFFFCLSSAPACFCEKKLRRAFIKPPKNSNFF